MIACTLAQRWIYGFLTLIESQPRLFSPLNRSEERKKQFFFIDFTRDVLRRQNCRCFFQTHYPLFFLYHLRVDQIFEQTYLSVIT